MPSAPRLPLTRKPLIAAVGETNVAAKRGCGPGDLHVAYDASPGRTTGRAPLSAPAEQRDSSGESVKSASQSEQQQPATRPCNHKQSSIAGLGGLQPQAICQNGAIHHKQPDGLLVYFPPLLSGTSGLKLQPTPLIKQQLTRRGQPPPRAAAAKSPALTEPDRQR